MAVIARPISARGLIGRAVGALRTGAAFNPVDLPDLLAYYDIRQAGTLFQDTAGTTSVAVATDPIGRWDAVGPSGAPNWTQGTATSRPLYQLTPTRAEFDLLDDSLSVTLPAISGGQIVIVSPAGIWIDSLNFAGGAFTLGPSTYTGGPDGLLSLLDGDVTAVYILDAPLSVNDQAALVAFETARGSAGLITLGGEIVPLPVKFDSVFWTNVNISSELDNVFTTSAAGGQITAAAFTVGRKYIVDFACVSAANVGLYNSNGATDAIGVAGVNLNSRTIFEAASSFFYVRHAAAGTVTVSTISAREVILP